MTSVTINTAREAIYSRWITNWASTTAFTFANEKYKAPTDTAWVRLTVNHEAGEQHCLGKVGDRQFLRRGRLLIQVFVPVDQGLYSGDQLADQARDIFEGTSFSGVYFTNVDIRESGSDGEWFQFLVDAPFDYLETK